MRIAFYAPLKPPDHPVPSGDRTMARALIRVLEDLGHEVFVASRMRGFMRTPSLPQRQRQAAGEIARIWRAWQAGERFDVWFCYHPYYKAPDLIGPEIVARCGVAAITAEASWSRRRQQGEWAPAQAAVEASLKSAAANLYMTGIDRDGLAEVVDADRLIELKPFIDTEAIAAPAGRPSRQPVRLITVAMMRPGDKMRSYAMLAQAVGALAPGRWRLAIVGDGKERRRVEAAFAAVDAHCIDWLGELDEATVGDELARSDIFVWPGYGEAYGLAYLEAQARGLPVVAQNINGVPAVVTNGVGGILTEPGDVAAMSAALQALIEAPQRRRQMGAAGRRMVLAEHNVKGAREAVKKAMALAVAGRQK